MKYHFPGKFFAHWSQNNQKIDYIYATHDKALKDIMRFAIKIQGYWEGHVQFSIFEPIELELITKFITGMDKDRGISKESTDVLEKKAAFLTTLESKLLKSN